MIAQSEEFCEQCTSCIEKLWKDTEFILHFKVYRYFSKYNFPEDEELSGGVVIAGINKLYCNICDGGIFHLFENMGMMIIDEEHRATTSMYDKLL